MNKKIAADQKQRDLALDSSKSYIVQAPAGSGKTEILSTRILSLLCVVEKPEQILAITFTKKAASEMLDRVYEKLLNHSNPEPESEFEKLSWELANKVIQRDKEKNWKILENLDRFRIRTIDSFTKNLISNTPLISGVGAGVEFTENAESLFHEAVDLMIEEYDDHPFLRQVLDHLDMDFDGFRRLMIQMLHKRLNWQDLIKRNVPSQELFNQSYESISKEYLNELKETLDSVEVKNDLWPIIKSKYFDDLAWHKGFLDIDNPSFCPGFEIEYVPFWKIVRAEVLTKSPGTVRKKIQNLPRITPEDVGIEGFKDFLKRHEEDHKLEDALKKICLLPDQFNSLAQNLEIFYATLGLALEKLNEVFSNYSIIDFNESSIRALTALGEADDPSDLLLKIDNDLHHILIDEFQDTNFNQKQLLEKITSGWSVGDGRTIFLVGDPMQSIYRFRQAEVGIFIDYAEKAKRNIGLPLSDQIGVVGDIPLEFLSLSVNFRSNKNIIDWVNNKFSKKFPLKDNPVLGAISYTPSESFKDASSEDCVQIHSFLKDTKGCYENAVNIAKKALESHPNSSKPVGILVKSRSHLENLVEQLVSAGISVKAVEMVSLGDTEEIMDLVQLIRLLSHKGDRLAWMSILRSPMCGLTLKTLTRIFESRRNVSPASALREVLKDSNFKKSIDENEFMRLFYVSDILLRNPLNYPRVAFPQFVSMVWEDLGANKIYSSEIQQANIKRVIELLEKSSPYGAIDIEGFERNLQKLYAQDVVSGPAVEIMTMHSAKGLEFDEVILFGLNRKPPNNQANLIEFENYGNSFLVSSVGHKGTGVKDDLFDLINQRNKERDEFETMRLIYVACTRAKRKLHLFVNITNKNETVSAGSIAGQLGLQETDEFSITKNYVPSEEIQDEKVTTLIDKSIIKRLTIDEFKVPTADSSSIANLAIRESKTWQFDDQYISCVGHVVHMWLERMGRDKLVGWDFERIKNARGLVQKHLHTLGLPNVALTGATTRVIKLLLKAYDNHTVKWLLTNANAMQEWSLFDEMATERRFDVVVDNGDHWLLVDFKTNIKHEDEEYEDFIGRMIRVYTPQLNMYAKYLQSFNDKPVIKKLLVLETCEFIDL
ncbi:putative nuclease/helicase [Taylorella equigenitalis 14/56]|uniref:DNA 3'-5' helicase n=1 Tax=Taylorella equigenitalis 14/56 TaxID=1091497 RepID=I7IBE6_9BURK|nr:UvrD-helicase domain-containing protein [Taylorella equigenitalis]CCG18661.1 putative nuclease/helicase [Taylorella equigenitalis 14/56]